VLRGWIARINRGGRTGILDGNGSPGQSGSAIIRLENGVPRIVAVLTGARRVNGADGGQSLIVFVAGR